MSKQNEIQQRITDQIIVALESGSILPWRKPWSAKSNVGYACNVISQKLYRGINPMLLSLHQNRFGFESRHFGTFNQWKKLGGIVKQRPADVRPGEWGCPIVYYNIMTKKYGDPITGIEVERNIPIFRTFTVFSVEQVLGDHLDKYRADKEIVVEHDFIDFEPAERFLANLNFDVRYGGNSAFYRVGGHIQMPHKSAFESPKDFYATLFHECIHNTCHLLGIKENYETEELVAEIGSCYLLSAINIPCGDNLDNSKSYLKHWLSHLKNDPKYIFFASAKASRCVDYLMKKSGFIVSQESEEELTTATA